MDTRNMKDRYLIPLYILYIPTKLPIEMNRQKEKEKEKKREEHL